MRKIVPDFTDQGYKTESFNELSNLYLLNGKKVNTYRELVQIVANISYWNKDYLIFFRGQTFDYKNRAGNSSFYPTIYRKDPLTKNERLYNFRKLNKASKSLISELERLNIAGWNEVARLPTIQWSLLQHYEVTATPLIDVTHSLRVACSFAQYKNNKDDAYVYVFGLPYMNSRITRNCEHMILFIRLLGIAPSIALRPHFQEGYLVGTEEITTDYSDKTELDLNNRLIAKFIIPNDETFWGDGFDVIPESALYPSNDEMEAICTKIKNNLEISMTEESVGKFLINWNNIEKALLSYNINKYSKSVYNINKAIKIIADKETQLNPLLKEVEKFKDIRNKIVHNISFNYSDVSNNILKSQESLIDKLTKALK